MHTLKKVLKELQKKEIEEANNLGIDGVPAIRINIETKIGIMPYEELKKKTDKGRSC